MTDAIPTISLAGARETVLDQLDSAFRDFGFCVCTDTGIPSDVMAEAFAASQRFHALSDAEKSALAINAYHRGYIAPDSNTTHTSSVTKVTKPNTSESLMVMHEVSEADPRFGEPLQGPNQWPENLPGFYEAVEAYRAEVEVLARRLAAMMLEILNVAPEIYEDWFRQPTEFLRFLHYPPEAADAPENSFGSAPHTDHGFLTIVAQDDVGGLEVETNSGGEVDGGGWIPALPEGDAVVINVADMLEHLSGGRWRSSPHRVKNTFGRERFSIAYFFDPDMKTDITPVTGDGKTVNYGDYILSKFDTNYEYRSGTS